MRFFNVLNTVNAPQARRAALAVAGVCAALSAGTAAAQPVKQGYLVRYDDLEIRSPAGAQRLLARIDFAARQVCGGAPSMVDLTGAHHFNACRRDAVARAVRRVDAPMLDSVAQGGPSPLSLARGK